MIIQNSKTYNVNEVENLFFRPSFCGKSAEELGIRVLYNMPVPTKIPTFGYTSNVLRDFSAGWQGGNSADWEEKEIVLKKLKAESSYSAESYFSSVYDLLTCSAEVNLGDLTGTDLEMAETELFRRAIVESVSATMWFGDESCDISTLSGFDGFLRQIINYGENEDPEAPIFIEKDEVDMDVVYLFRNLWTSSSPELKNLASEGQLTYFVTPDIYDAYLFSLEDRGISSVVIDTTDTNHKLSYHGIPIEVIPVGYYGLSRATSFCVLTDRRNLILALNTADSPEKEIHMWYNPDEMENRQRVVFLAGTGIAHKSLLAAHIFDAGVNW